MFKLLNGVLFAVLLAWSHIVGAADTKVIIGIPTTTLSLSSLFIAKDAGFLVKEGIAVEERVIVGVGAVDAVIAGTVDFAIGSGSSFTRANAQGQKLLGIGLIVDKPLIELVIRKDIADAARITRTMPLAERVKHLKGRTIAIQGFGGALDASVRLILAHGGLDYVKDVRITQMDPPAMLAALKGKQIDAFATSLPFTTQALVEGIAVPIASLPIGDLPQYNPFAYLMLMTRPDVCKEQRQMCVNVASALGNANKYMHEHSDEAKALMKRRFKDMNPVVFDAAWPTVAGAHPTNIALNELSLENAQRFGVDAKLEDAKDSVKDLKGLFTNEFLN